MRIEIQLSTAPKFVRRQLDLTLAGRAAAERIMANVLGGCVVLSPSLRFHGNGETMNSFGVDEPDPRDLLSEHLGTGGSGPTSATG